MAPQTFTSFARLPQELRDKIWECAVMLRPDPLVKPGAHFFTLVSKNVWAMNYPGLIRQRGYFLSPPSRHASLSAYLIDGGLWTACRDSRRAMNKRYQVKLERNLWRNKKRLDSPMTQYFDPRGQPRAFTTIPGADLICLQPLDLSVLGLEDMSLECLGLSGPPFSWREYKHIAFEYNPMWLDDMLCLFRAAAFPTTLAATTDEHLSSVKFFHELQGVTRLWAEGIWLIDFSIRRIPMVDTVDDRAVFYGDGCRFTEVVSGDPGWLPDTYGAVDSLEAILPSNRPHDLLRQSISVGILACEMLSE